MFKMKYSSIENLSRKHKNKHEGYEHTRLDFVYKDESEKMGISVYEIPPGQSAYPYHYHHKNEECFYIISGEGILRTPEGERIVKAGDLLYFPANENGAHKLTNGSDTEKLVYLDVDVIHNIDVSVYPDSNKIGVWGTDTNRIYRLDDDVDYYEGE